MSRSFFRESRAVFLAPMVFFLPCLVGCRVYDESLLLEAGEVDGTMPWGGGVGWWSGIDPETQCLTASMPQPEDRPGKSDPGPSIDPMVFAIRSMRLGSLDPSGNLSKTAWQDIGFDLDGTCTRSPTCHETEAIMSCRSLLPVVPGDGNYCRDNRFGEMEYAIATNPDIGKRFGLDDHTFNCSLCVGAYNMLFRISDYNGQPNDAAIRVDIYPSPGLEVLKDMDCHTARDFPDDQCWHREDAWMVQSDYVNEPVGSVFIGNSKLDDSTAYVRQGYVVARLRDNTQFWFPGDRGIATAFPMVMQGGLVTGKLVQHGDGVWELEDGMIAGRMDVKDAVAGFQSIGLCDDDPLAPTVEGYAKTWADVLSSGAVLPDVTCDALSVGIAFEASQATMGMVTKVEVPSPCAAVNSRIAPGHRGGVD